MRRLFFSVLACVLLLCAVLSCRAEAVESEGACDSAEAVEDAAIADDTEELGHWQVVMEDTILPVVAAVISGSILTYLMTLPVLAIQRKRMREVKEAVELFTSATGGVLKASEISTSTDSKVKEFEERLAARERDRQLSEERFGRLLGIFATVFCANEEMVKSGAAREIKKAVEDYVGRAE